jgi:alkaline phosphatase D
MALFLALLLVGYAAVVAKATAAGNAGAVNERGISNRRIAFGSCHNQLREGIFNVIESFQPEQLILLGDNVYVDTKKLLGFVEASPEQITNQYCILNGDSSWQRLVRHIGGFNSIFATWDDHDYGIDNGDASYRYKNESMNSFFNFFRVPIDSPRRLRDGVYYSTIHEISQKNGEVYTYKIITLDTRYNMVSQRNNLSGKPEMLGNAQWQWLQDELLDATVDIIFLGSSVQILPTDKLISESWFFHDPQGRERLLSLISNSPCPNVILLTGDVHEAEVSQVYNHLLV